MRGPGLFSTIQIAAGMSMAGPMYVLGFDMVMNGRSVAGVGFFTLGLIAMFAPTYVVRRIGGPRTWIRRWLGRVRSSNATAEDEGNFDPFDDG